MNYLHSHGMELNLTDKQRINWARISAIVAILILMIYAPKLWLTDKVFPVIPLFDWLSILTGIFDNLFWDCFSEVK
mgnify:FL=1